MADKYDIFISLRFQEAGKDWPIKGAEKLKAKLEAKGYRVFLCDVDSGRDIFEVVSNAMVNSKMFIVFGSQTYGFQTASKCSTYQEFNFIIDEKKPFFLFKMCDIYEVATTKVTLNRDVAYEKWYPFESPDVPEISFQNIMKKFQSLYGDNKVVSFIIFSFILCL